MPQHFLRPGFGRAQALQRALQQALQTGLPGDPPLGPDTTPMGSPSTPQMGPMPGTGDGLSHQTPGGATQTFRNVPVSRFGGGNLNVPAARAGGILSTDPNAPDFPGLPQPAPAPATPVSSQAAGAGQFGSALTGFDLGKLNDPGRNSPKTLIGRVLSRHDPRQGITDAALADLNALGIGQFAVAGSNRDKLVVSNADPRFEGFTTIDVIPRASQGGTGQWQYLPDSGGAGESAGGQGGADEGGIGRLGRLGQLPQLSGADPFQLGEVFDQGSIQQIIQALMAGRRPQGLAQALLSQVGSTGPATGLP